MSQNGKGDTPRPKSVSDEEWTKNWNLAFVKAKPAKPAKKAKKAAKPKKKVAK